jgi:hypothetical protein
MTLVSGFQAQNEVIESKNSLMLRPGGNGFPVSSMIKQRITGKNSEITPKLNNKAVPKQIACALTHTVLARPLAIKQ